MSALAMFALQQLPPTEAPAMPVVTLQALGFWLVVVSITLLVLPFAARLVRGISPREESPRVPWGARHVLLVMIAIFLVGQLLGAMLPADEENMLQMLASSAAVLGAGVLVVVAVAARSGVDGFRALGLRLSGNVRASVAGLMAYGLLCFGLVALGPLWFWILELCGHTAEGQPIIGDFARLEPHERLIPILIGAGLQPLSEEILFRGFLQPFLVQVLRPVAGIAITAFAFAALHGLDSFLPIFALALVLGWIRQHTQRLSAVWAMHALHNGAQFAVLYLAPDWLDNAVPPGVMQP